MQHTNTMSPVQPVFSNASLTPTGKHVNIAYLGLPTIFYQALSPATSVLMDICQLPWLAVKQTLPLISQLLGYHYLALSQTLTLSPTKVSKVSQTQAVKSNSGSMAISATTSLDTLLKSTACQSIKTLIGQDRLGFTQVKQLQQLIPRVKHAIFADNQAYQQMVGVLMAKTHLPATKIGLLLDWCGLLSLGVLADINFLLSDGDTPPKNAQFTSWQLWLSWLSWQPLLLAQPLNENHITENHTPALPTLVYLPEFAWVTGYHDPFSQQTRQQQVKELFRYPTLIQQHVATLISDYLASRPYAIAPPLPPKKTATVSLNQPSATLTNPSNPSQAHDIFAAPPKTKLRWVDTLQKYWIATAVVASGLVFGGIGLFATSKQPSPFEPKKSTAVASTPKYNDVAIIRVASEPQPASVTTGDNKKSANQKTDTNKLATSDKKSVREKTTTAKTSEQTTPKHTNSTNLDKKSTTKPTVKSAAKPPSTDKKATSTKATAKPTEKTQDKRADKKKQNEVKTEKKSTVSQKNTTAKKASTKQPTDKKATN